MPYSAGTGSMKVDEIINALDSYGIEATLNWSDRWEGVEVEMNYSENADLLTSYYAFTVDSIKDLEHGWVWAEYVDDMSKDMFRAASNIADAASYVDRR